MREKLKHIFLVLTPAEKKQFWIQILLNIFISIADIAMLAALLFVVSFYVKNSSATSLKILPQWLSEQGSLKLILVFFILFAIKNFLGVMISNAQFQFISKVATRISEQKLKAYLMGGVHQFVNIDSSEHIRKIAFQPFEFCQHILLNVQQVIIQSFLVLSTMAAIIFFDPKLFFLLLLLLVPPVTVVFFYIKRRSFLIKKNIHMANESSFRYLLDALKGYAESNIYQRNDFFVNRFSTVRKQFSEYLFTSLSYQTMPARIIETFAVLGLFILITVVKWSGTSDNSTLITIGAFMAAAYKIIPGIVKMINAGGQIRTYDLSIDDDEFKIHNDHPGKEISSVNSLQLKNIDFSYNDLAVVKNFSLCINKGDLIGITGRSGKGKTTILNLLLGFLKPSNGEIFVNGSSASLKDYWPLISYVRQQPFLIHDTILKNITLSDKEDAKKVQEVITTTGLKELIDQSPEALNKMITENGKNISGGQQQRIAIARALYKDAELILLDEPFNELDEASTLLLIKSFKRLAESGKMVVLVTHDPRCLAHCNKIISLDEQ